MKKTVPAAVFAAIGIGSQVFLSGINPSATPALAGSVIASLGSLRAIAAEIVWFRADRLQEEGKYVELAQLASTLTFLEPHVPEVWSHSAWNLAYNISVMMPTYEDRWRWVYAAVELLRDGGLGLNPHDAQLYGELAWLFELKMGADIDDASAVYRRKWREKTDAAAASGDWMSLGMDRTQMDAIERKYGLSDWGNPLLSAIYWAHAGLVHARGERQKAFLENIISQSLILYRKLETGDSPECATTA